MSESTVRTSLKVTSASLKITSAVAAALAFSLAGAGSALADTTGGTLPAAVTSVRYQWPDAAATASAARTSGAHGFSIRRDRCRSGYAVGFSRRWALDRLRRWSPDTAPATPAAAPAVGFGVGPDKPGLRLLTRESQDMSPVQKDGAHVLAPSPHDGHHSAVDHARWPSWENPIEKRPRQSRDPARTSESEGMASPARTVPLASEVTS